MHGPYVAKVKTAGGTVRLDVDELTEGARIADRCYSSGGGIGVLSGFTRAAVFAAGSILVSGESAEIEIVGRVNEEVTR